MRAMQTKGHTDVTTTPSADPDLYEITNERAKMLALHAIHVQGGFSTPEIEAERASKDMAMGRGPINWDKMQAEVTDALLRLATADPEPTPAPAPAAPAPAAASQRVNVTAVLASI